MRNYWLQTPVISIAAASAHLRLRPKGERPQAVFREDTQGGELGNSACYFPASSRRTRAVNRLIPSWRRAINLFAARPSRLYVTLVLSALCLKQFRRHAQDAW